MKTISVHDLPQQMAQVIAWAMKGEEVRVLPQVKPAEAPQPEPAMVDWSKSAAYRDRTSEQMLSAEDVRDLFDEVRGQY